MIARPDKSSAPKALYVIPVPDGVDPLPDPARHNYYVKLVAMMNRADEIAPGVHEINIYHDGGCAIYGDKPAYCNCDPIVEWKDS